MQTSCGHRFYRGCIGTFYKVSCRSTVLNRKCRQIWILYSDIPTAQAYSFILFSIYCGGSVTLDLITLLLNFGECKPSPVTRQVTSSESYMHPHVNPTLSPFNRQELISLSRTVFFSMWLCFFVHIPTRMRTCTCVHIIILM